MSNNISVLFFSLVVFASNGFSQGRNHVFLLGYDTGLFDTNVTSTKARLLIDSSNLSIVPETRKMAFWSTQGNISDENGNLLMSSNGCWIANATGDTMLNGSGLNPGLYTDDWNDSILGLPIPYGNVILPYPDDSTKYILFHQTGNYNANLVSTQLYYSLIDMTLDSGLGGVLLKNQVVANNRFSYGIGACKHANGRDWWVVIMKDSSNIMKEILLTPTGIASITNISMGNLSPLPYINVSIPTFSPDGNKFAFMWGWGGPSSFHNVVLYDFDRCSGAFSNLANISFAGSMGFGLAFSPNSKYLYNSSWHTIWQLNTDTSDIPASIDTVAINDGYYSPYPPFQTDFWTMYLAANGKIYLSSGNGVIDMHYINYPDSEGVACDVHQHGLHSPCFFVRAHVNHPNYYLGPVIGSTCDSLVHVGVNELIDHDFHFSISPNPVSNQYLKIIYLLPQNKCGVFEIYDISGRIVYKISLPPWSTLQQITLPKLESGIYYAIITSGWRRVDKKIAVINE